jgi:hypothetical protein
MTSDQPWWLAWPPAEVAATILPLFSYETYIDELKAINNILSWCQTGSFGKKAGSGGYTARFTDPDGRAITEAIQVLENSALLMRTIDRTDMTNFVVGLTRLGMHALQTNTVRQHLGLSDAPPPA